MADSTKQMPMLHVANRRLIDDGADVTLWISKGSELEATPSKFDKLPRPVNSVLHIFIYFKSDDERNKFVRY